MSWGSIYQAVNYRSVGRHSNIISDDKDFIIDSVKEPKEEISRVRQVLPGNPYLFPPSQIAKSSSPRTIKT